MNVTPVNTQNQQSFGIKGLKVKNKRTLNYLGKIPSFLKSSTQPPCPWHIHLNLPAQTPSESAKIPSFLESFPQPPTPERIN